jgi:hypothetical protein
MWLLDCNDTCVIPYAAAYQVVRSTRHIATLTEQRLFLQRFRGMLPPVPPGVPLSRKTVCLLECDDARLSLGSNTICCSSFVLERLPPLTFVIPLHHDLLQQLLDGKTSAGTFRGSIVADKDVAAGLQ